MELVRKGAMGHTGAETHIRTGKEAQKQRGTERKEREAETERAGKEREERERERRKAAPKTPSGEKKMQKVCHCKPCHQFQILFRVLSVVPGFACSVASLGPYPGYHLPGIAELPA